MFQYPQYPQFPRTMMPYSPMMGVPQQQVVPPQPSGTYIPGGAVPGAVPGAVAAVPFVEESYIENILRLNLGKVATVYMTFENSTNWKDKIFQGVLLQAGRDHIILQDAQGVNYLLLTVYLDYVTFDEPITYTLTFPGYQGSTPTTR